MYKYLYIPRTSYLVRGTRMYYVRRVLYRTIGIGVAAGVVARGGFKRSSNEFGGLQEMGHHRRSTESG